MDLRHLHAFVAVAEEGAFTRAANRLHISQPPLSKQVRQLERELGTTLFLRRRDGVELTRDGAMLLEHAQAALTAFHEFEECTKSVSARARPLRVGKAAGIHPHIVGAQPAPFAQGAMMLVASRQGYYVGIASPFTQTHRVSGVAVIPLEEPDARLQVRIAWRQRDALRSVAEFVRSARAVFRGRSIRLRPAPRRRLAR